MTVFEQAIALWTKNLSYSWDEHILSYSLEALYSSYVLYSSYSLGTFSHTAVSQKALSCSLDEQILVKLNENKIQTEFESFYYNIMQHTGRLRHNEQVLLKNKIRQTCENFYRIKTPYRYKEIIRKLSNSKDIIILKPDKGCEVVVLNCSSYIEKCCNILTSDQFRVFEYDPTKPIES